MAAPRRTSKILRKKNQDVLQLSTHNYQNRIFHDFDDSFSSSSSDSDSENDFWDDTWVISPREAHERSRLSLRRHRPSYYTPTTPSSHSKIPSPNYTTNNGFTSLRGTPFARTAHEVLAQREKRASRARRRRSSQALVMDTRDKIREKEAETKRAGLSDPEDESAAKKKQSAELKVVVHKKKRKNKAKLHDDIIEVKDKSPIDETKRKRKRPTSIPTEPAVSEKVSTGKRSPMWFSRKLRRIASFSPSQQRRIDEVKQSSGREEIKKEAKNAKNETKKKKRPPRRATKQTSNRAKRNEAKEGEQQKEGLSWEAARRRRLRVVEEREPEKGWFRSLRFRKTKNHRTSSMINSTTRPRKGLGSGRRTASVALPQEVV